VFSPLEDERAVENLPEPTPLTPEQMRAQAEADERDRQRQREWALVVQALNDNSLAVFRALHRFRNETEQEQVQRVLTSYEAGSFLIDRLGAGLVVDQDLAVVLPTNRNRPRSAAGRCGARTRRGTICQAPAMLNGRCRIHGGRSPGAPRGERNGRWRGGFFSRHRPGCRRDSHASATLPSGA
jgi:hypothetical protein